jgi:hypothetical protein
MRVPPEMNAMTDLWNWRDTARSQATDLVGFQVVATDGAIGNIDAATHDVGESYIVADTASGSSAKSVCCQPGSSTESTTTTARSPST